MNISKYYLQILLGLIGLCVGYPHGGTLFILAMIPFVLKMMLSKDINYLPALMLHCTSGTSIYTVAMFAAVYLVCMNVRKQENKAYRRFVYCLLFLMPVYFLIVYQRLSYAGDNMSQALASFGVYYLSLWFFPYCYLIGGEFSKKTIHIFLFAIVTLKCAQLLGLCEFYRLTACVNFVIPAYGVYYLLNGQRGLGLLFLTLSIPFIITDEDITFTLFFTMFLSMSLTYAYIKKKGWLRYVTGYYAFVVIVALIFYGSNNYQGLNVTSADHIDFSSFDAFTSRLSYKFFADRAPFWSSGILQIIQYHPMFPNPDLPELYSIAIDGHEIDNSTYGSHNILIEYVRRFGYIPGLLLCFLLIWVALQGRRYMIDFTKCNYDVPLFISAISSYIVLCLTGTLTVLPEYALYTVGLMGIAYKKYQISQS